MESGTMVYMTNEEVRKAIEFWWNEKHNKRLTYPQLIAGVKAMPASDQFCLSLQFGIQKD